MACNPFWRRLEYPPVIYFVCTFCKDDLEIDDQAGGTRMECPNCDQVITVPKEGLDIERVRDEDPKRRKEPASGSKLKALLLGIGVILVGGGAAGGVYYLEFLERPVEDTRAPCGSCTGSGLAECSQCKGTRATLCGQCNGTGSHTNVRDQAERCYACTGLGKINCAVCGGKGTYSCKACGGTGKQGGKAPALPISTPENP